MQSCWVMLSLLLSPDHSFFWPCNSICFVIVLVLVWQQTEQRKTSSWLTCSPKKIMSWWDLGFKKISFISGQKEGRNSNSNYTKICFVRCRPGNGGCQMENTLCSVCWCLRVMMTPFVSLLSFVPIAAVISFPLSPQILFLITVLNNCAI